MSRLMGLIAMVALVGSATMFLAPTAAIAGGYYGSAGHSYFHDDHVRHLHYPNVGHHGHMPLTRAHTHEPAYNILRIHVQPPAHAHRRVEHRVSEYTHRHQ